MAITVKCRKHPEYLGKRDPKVKCEWCWDIRDMITHPELWPGLVINPLKKEVK